MGKLEPRERWDRHVLEGYVAFRQSPERRRLRREGLAILGRERLLTAQEWWDTFTERASSPEYRAWAAKCGQCGRRFGLAQWTVTAACLYRGYRPETSGLQVELAGPRVRVIADMANEGFIGRLSQEAQRLGTYLVSGDTTYVGANSLSGANAGPTAPQPAPATLFHMRVEFPPGYPPEAAAQLAEWAASASRELLRRLGYKVPQRLRSSPLVKQARKLKIGGGPLRYGESYKLMMERGYLKDDLRQDQKTRNLIKSRRYKVNKRVVEPYVEKSTSAKSTRKKQPTDRKAAKP